MKRKLLATLGIAALAILVAGAALTAGLGTAGAQTTDDTSDDRTISVSATGDATAAPNQAVLSLAVTATGEDPAEVRDDLASGAEDLRSALDRLDASYETVSYSLEEPRRYEERPETPDYRGRHILEVTVDTPDNSGSVVDAAANAGASVQQVSLTLSDDRRTEIRDRAITNAMTDARQQATTIGAAADLEIDGVFSVEASQQRYRPVQYEAAAAGDGGDSTTIDSGDVTVAYRVQVVYNATGA